MGACGLLWTCGRRRQHRPKPTGRAPGPVVHTVEIVGTTGLRSPHLVHPVWTSRLSTYPPPLLSTILHSSIKRTDTERALRARRAVWSHARRLVCCSCRRSSCLPRRFRARSLPRHLAQLPAIAAEPEGAVVRGEMGPGAGRPPAVHHFRRGQPVHVARCHADHRRAALPRHRAQ